MTAHDRIAAAEAGSWGESPTTDLPTPRCPAVERRLALYGAPGIRDPDAPCPSREFEPGTPSGDCKTDGHYMCRECIHCELCEGCGLIEARCECLPEDRPIDGWLRIIAIEPSPDGSSPT